MGTEYHEKEVSTSFQDSAIIFYRDWLLESIWANFMLLVPTGGIEYE